MKYREDPHKGDVIAVKIRGEVWAYFICLRESRYYICEFLSRGIIRDPEMFTAKHWLAARSNTGCSIPKSPFKIITFSSLTSNYFTIGKTEIPREYSSPMEYSFNGKNENPIYWLRSELGDKQVSEIVAKQYAHVCGIDEQKIDQFIDTIRQQMTIVQGDPSIVPPAAPLDEPADVVFELDFLGGTSADTGSMEDEIGEEADHEGINLECMGSDGFSCDPSEASQALAVIRRALKRVLPKEEWELVQIVRHGPKQGQIRTCGLLPTPRKKPEA